ncbi:MAG: universal stress protein [Pseudomonadota bacterium]
MFKTIVIGVDGSARADAALRAGCDIAERYGAQVHLVHTPQPQTVAFALGAVAGYHSVVTMPDLPEVERAADKVIQAATAAAQECGVQIAASHIAQGEPADQIVDYAASVGADLIVTGRRGLGSGAALVVGSTTQRVNHLAQCATLSVV